MREYIESTIRNYITDTDRDRALDIGPTIWDATGDDMQPSEPDTASDLFARSVSNENCTISR